MSANRIHTPRYGNTLARLLAFEEKNPAGELATEIFPGITLENDREEFKLLGGTNLGGAQGGALNAGGFAANALFNPVGSERVVVVTHALGGCTLAAAGMISFGLTFIATGQTRTNTEIVIDTRSRVIVGTPAFVRPVAINVSYNAGLPADTQAIWRSQQPAGTVTALYPGAVVLGPGSGMIVFNGVVNTVISGSWRWYERVMTARELELLG